VSPYVGLEALARPGLSFIRAASSWRTQPWRPRARLVAVRRRAVLMMPEGGRPTAFLLYWRSVNLEDAADDSAVGQHIVIVVVPIAGWATG